MDRPPSSSRPASRTQPSPRVGSSKRRAHSVESSDSDEIIFVGATVGAALSAKYSFNGAPSRPPSRSRSRSRSVAADTATGSGTNGAQDGKGKGKAIAGKGGRPKQDVRDVLLPQLDVEPAPVPPWLGHTKILLQTKSCPVCKREWKRSESGAVRWVRETEA